MKIRASRVLRTALGIASLLLCYRVPADGPTTQPSGTMFLRFVEERDGDARLEVAETAYTSKDGVSVRLIGAVHIADPEFFHGLNESFDHYDALLYEMVKPKDADAVKRIQQTRGGGGSWISGVQVFLKNRLGLTFQLEEVEYDKPNFVHADLDWETFSQRQDEKGESITGMMFKQAMHEYGKQMSGKGNAARSQTASMALLGAIMSKDSDYQLKLVLGRQFGEIEGMMYGLEGPDGSVIITERNKKAMEVMDQSIADGKKNIGIFYGAGHFSGMEKMLLDRGFKCVGQTWRVAWDIPKKKIPATQPAASNN